MRGSAWYLVGVVATVVVLIGAGVLDVSLR